MSKYITQTNLLAFVCVCLFTILIMAVTVRFTQSPAIDAVLSGEALLECHMSDGIRIIDTHKIIEHMDGVWFFEDGYAKQCRIIHIQGDM